MLRKLSEWYKPSLAEKRINAGDWRGGDWGLDLPILILSLTWQPPGSFPLILDMETQVRFLSPVHTPLWIGWFVYSIVLLASSFLFQVFGVPKVNFYFQTGLHNLLQPSSRVARKWRENEKMKRKWRENEEMERGLLSTFHHFLLIFSLCIHFQIKNCLILSKNLNYATFVANVKKTLETV